MFSQVELQLHHLPGLFSANMDAKLSELRAELAAVMTHHLRKVSEPDTTQCNIAPPPLMARPVVPCCMPRPCHIVLNTLLPSLLPFP